MDEQIEKLMLDAIEEKRPNKILPLCREVWNQPFFYKIDKAKAITISYNPTDKGAKTNYLRELEEYKNGTLKSNEILKILYNFKEEPHWRKNYNLIFEKLGVDCFEIAHMDMSCFPYDKDSYRKKCKDFDHSYKYPLRALELQNYSFIIINVLYEP